MSIKSEIARAENNVTKLKKGFNNINTRLVECGGENAINLADVPNKIDGMLGNYNRYAIVNLNTKIEFKPTKDNRKIVEMAHNIPLNLNFTPRRVIMWVRKTDHIHNASGSANEVGNFAIDSKYNNTKDNRANWSNEVDYNKQRTTCGLYITDINNMGFNLNTLICNQIGFNNTVYPPIHILLLG